MANNIHSDITDDSNLHKPYGFAGAVSNSAPYKDSSGNLIWSPGVLTKKVEITSAEMLNINTIAKELIAAPGAGYIIRLLDVMAFLDYNSAAYVTGGNKFTIEYGTSGLVCLEIADGLITSSSDKIEHGTYPSNTELSDNESLVATIATADPTAGDSPLYLYLTYYIIEL